MTSHDTNLVPFPSVRPRGMRRLASAATHNSLILPDSSNRLVRLFEDLLEGFDERRLRIVYLRTFQTPSGPTLQNLGNIFGVSRERVRQIESSCIKTIARRLETARFRPLIEASARIAAEIGLAVPVSMARAAGLLSTRLPIGSIVSASSESFLRAFLVSQGGSYELRDGWMIKRPAARYIRKTRIVTNSLLRRGPASADQVIAKVCALGFRRDVTPQWISAFGQVRILGSAAIRWRRSMADKAVALLEYQGEPMSRRGISELMGFPHNITALSNCLSMDDRVERIRRDLYGLRKWHGTTWMDKYRVNRRLMIGR